MAKKLKKSKKAGLSPKAKFTIASAFKGIISNQAVIDGSKESPWWVAAIFFAFSVIIPLLPNFVRMSNTRGGSFLSSVNYGFDVGATALAYQYKVAGKEYVAKGGTLHYYENGTEVADGGFETPDQAYLDDRQETFNYVSSNTHQYVLRVFFWKGLSESKMKKYVNIVAKQKYYIGTTDVDAPEEDPKPKYYIPNLLFVTPKTLALALYKENSTTQATTSLGGLDWTNTSSKVGLIDRLLKAGIKDGVFNDMTPSLSQDQYINKYRSKTKGQFVNIFNETYLTQKEKTKWSNTGIYAGIYAGVVLFLGLMIFVLTRGKNNPFKYLNVWHCQKIAWWAAFTPAILGTILALIFAGNAIGQMAFILVVSLRVMWLSMKQLRPVYNQ